MEGRKKPRLRDRRAEIMLGSEDGKDRVRRASEKEEDEGGWRLSERGGKDREGW